MHPEARRLNDLSERIIGAAIVVHRALGPGLLEAPYEECLCHELETLGLTFERQKPLALNYGSVTLACARHQTMPAKSVTSALPPRKAILVFGPVLHVHEV